ncbi:proline-rich protein 2-like [Sturnira hondurensis]|uniref:proline-rich protein 2-like n=1 Tax=Sturnira hondurensis TaxID=192404 RepID=UPI00187B06CD|nr:proline-rich protein 2-like [Sturnira hondurensis]
MRGCQSGLEGRGKPARRQAGPARGRPGGGAGSEGELRKRSWDCRQEGRVGTDAGPGPPRGQPQTRVSRALEQASGVIRSRWTPWAGCRCDWARPGGLGGGNLLRAGLFLPQPRASSHPPRPLGQSSHPRPASPSGVQRRPASSPTPSSRGPRPRPTAGLAPTPKGSSAPSGIVPAVSVTRAPAPQAALKPGPAPARPLRASAPGPRTATVPAPRPCPRRLPSGAPGAPDRAPAAPTWPGARAPRPQICPRDPALPGPRPTRLYRPYQAPASRRLSRSPLSAHQPALHRRLRLRPHPRSVRAGVPARRRP